MNARPQGMEAQFRLPPEVAEFLWHLHEPMAMATRFALWCELLELLKSVSHGNADKAQAGLSEVYKYAYMEGCRQGYIEGFVARRAPDVRRSRTANAAKRSKTREHNGMRYTLDQRDAAIVGEFTTLRPMVGATEAQYRLAQKYDLSDKMVRNILREAKRAAK